MTHPHHASDLDWATMVEFAELEAEVLTPFLSVAMSFVTDLSMRDVRHILDIGCGPGVGTCVLAEHFPSASVLAADGSAEMLANVTARAARLGVADRVETRLVELPDGIATLGRADLVWASLVLHHVGDEAAALRGLGARLEPGGLLALVEFGDPMRVLPVDVDLGRPGLWERLDIARASWLADMRAGLPGAVPSGEYAAMLQAVGFEVLADEVVGVDLPAPLDDRARAVALGHLRLVREHVEPYVDRADLEALDVLTSEDDPASITRRPDALLHASRRLLIGRAGGVTS